MARLTTLKDRRDFIRLKSGRRWVTPAFVLQAAPRPEGDDSLGPRFGFTVSRHAVAQQGAGGRKRGGAVRRNRARRRLKEAVRLVAPLKARPGYDYVLIGRAPALDQNFEDLVKDLHKAFAKVHGPDRRGQQKRRSNQS